MQRWEYRFLWVADTSEVAAEAAAQQLGGQGWELVNAEYVSGSGYMLYFKRPAV